MPTYVALIYGEDADWSDDAHATRPPSTWRFGEAAAAVIRGGDALQPTSTATTVRVQGGKGGDVVTSDGPFAETKEVLGGFYLLECADLDEAIRWAAQIPGAWRGSVEVRPVARVWDRELTAEPPRVRLAETIRVEGGGSSPPSPGRSAASTSPRTPCRTPPSRPWSAGRATASPTTRAPG